MKKKLLFLLGGAFLGGLFSLNVSAQTWEDVTATYLSNAGFDTESDWQSGNIAVNTAPKDVSNWTFAGSSSWVGSASFGFGGTGQINGAAIPSTNSVDAATGGCVAITGAWNGGSGNAAYTQSITLPAGSYKLEFMVNNVGKNSNFRTSLFGFNGIYGTTSSYPVNTWTTETVLFTLTAETKGNVSVGFGWPDTGSGNTPKLVVDYVKLYVDKSVDKTTLASLISTATTLYGTGEGEDAAALQTAINAAQSVYDDSAATASEVIVAESNLQSAIDAYKWANASESSPVDATSKLSNPGFEDGTGSWTLTKTMGGWVDCSINTTNPSEGNNCYNLWAGDVTSIDLSQAVVLSSGKYTLTADLRIDNSDNVTDQGVYAIVDGVTTKSAETITSVASTWNSVEGWNTLSVTFNVLNDNTSVTLGASSTGTGSGTAGWFQIDNFTLRYVGYDNTAALTALSEVITAAQAYTSAMIPDDIYNNLSSAITAAEAVVAKGSSATKSEISTASANLSPLVVSAGECKEPYTKLVALIAKATNEKDNSDAESAAKTTLEGAISTATTNAENKTTASDLEAEFTTLETARQTYVTVAKPNGTALDVTYQIGAVASSTTGWTMTTNAQNQVYKTSIEKNTASLVADGFIENWNGSAYTGRISYKKSGLPAGHYKVSAYAFDSGKTGNVKLFANNQSEPLGTETDLFTNPVIADVLVGEGADLEFGLSIDGEGATWVGIANVELYYFNVLSDAERVTAAKANLYSKIGAVTIPSANVGTSAFQIPSTAVNDISTAVSDAQSVYDNNSATLSEVETAITNLENAIAAFDAVSMNAPVDGQLFHIVLTYGGWTYDNKAMTYMAGDRSDMGGYNIKYAAEENTNLAQAFTFTKVSGNNYKLSQIDADGNVRYMTDTKTGYNSGDGRGIRTTTEEDQAAVFEIIPTSTEGVYNIWNAVANMHVGSQDDGVYTVNSHIDFKIVETTKASVAVNTTAAGWGTLMAPFAVSLPSGVKAYTCATVTNNELDLVEVNSLEANKPYIIEGSWNETLTGDAQGKALTYTEGKLTGVYAATEAPVGSYVMVKRDEVVFALVGSTAATVPANKCYLSASSNAPYLRIGGTTNISNVETEDEKVVFDLTGRRVDVPAKGIYIVNGKKVLVK